SHCLPGSPDSFQRITHVVERIHEADQVEFLLTARKHPRGRHLEPNLIGDSGLLRSFLCHGNRRFMVVNSHELRLRKCLRHKDDRGAVPAAEVGYTPAIGQLLLDTTERWNPGLSKVRPVSVAKKSLR